jgi:peptide chain release factor 2
MRERTDLESRITGYQRLERDLKDNVELIELG